MFRTGYALALVCAIGFNGAECQQLIDDVAFDALMTEVSNWGRWGPNDDLGTLNLITPAKRVQAASLIRVGRAVSLARELETERSEHNPRPLVREMVTTGLNPEGIWGMDRFSIQYHGLAHTHIDALGHAFYDGQMYNGLSQSLVGESGAEQLAITAVQDGIVTRGVLIDIPWLRGVDYLDPGESIYPDELDRWSAATGIEIESGDAVLIRTGRWARVEDVGTWPPFERLAGLHPSSVRWLKDRDIAVLGSDGGTETYPSAVEDGRGPLHQLVIVAMGTPMLDNLNLEDLSAEASAQGRPEFFFVAAPLRVPGGTGSPLNPIAIF